MAKKKLARPPVRSIRKDLRECLKECAHRDELYSSSVHWVKILEIERRKKLAKLLRLQIKTFARKS